MLNRFKSVSLLLFYIVAALCIYSCKTPEQFKLEADKDVYKIIDQKWREGYGEKANYIISDVEPNRPDINDLIPEDGVLSLKDAMLIATKFSRDYQNQKESLYLSALGLTQTRHEYATQWFGTVDVGYAGSNDDDAGTKDEITAASEVGFDKTTLLDNGIMISTGLAVDWTRFLLGDPKSTLGSVIFSTLTAPIIGAGAGKTAVENLTQAERDVIYDIRSFNRYRKNFVSQIVSEYFNVLQQRERVNISQASYKRLVDSTNQLRMEVDVGKRAQYDADEAEQRLLSAENSLISDRQGYEQALDSFKIRLSLPTDANITLDQNELKALENMGISQPHFTEEDAIAAALNNRLDLMNERDGLDDAARQLKLVAEELGVQLNLTATYDVTSRAPSTGQDFTQIQFHESAYTLAFDAELPLDQLSERNAYRRALISTQQRQRNYEQTVDEIKLDVRQAYRDLRETAESYRIQKIGLELALKRLDREKILLEYGEGTVRLLLESEDAIVSAENSVTNALVRHMTAKLNFYRDIGVLQVKPDGTWEQGE